MTGDFNMLLLIPAYKKQDLEFAIFLRNGSEKELEELKEFFENCESVLKNDYRILYKVETSKIKPDWLDIFKNFHNKELVDYVS